MNWLIHCGIADFQPRSQIGHLLWMGFEGTTITPQVRSLIEDHHVGAIALQSKNLKSGWLDQL